MIAQTILDSALDYANRGFGVIPTHGIIGDYCSCGRPKDDGHKAGKHPACEHGYKDATTDHDTIRRWYADKPWCNVAIVTGGEFFVLESDPQHGGDESIAALVERHGAMPSTPTVKSGGGGTHWYFAYPTDGRVVRSRAGVAPGVDVRGEGGIVVAPPSNHASGSRYEWVVNLDTPIADAPAWVLDLVCDHAATRAGVVGSITPPDAAFLFVDDENDFASHPGAGEGMRNDTLLRLLGIAFDRGVAPETIERDALAWGERCTPPIPEHDVRRRLAWVASRRDDPGSEGTIPGSWDGGASELIPSRREGINSPVSDPATGGVNSFLPFFPETIPPGKEPVAEGGGRETPPPLSTQLDKSRIPSYGTSTRTTSTDTQTNNDTKRTTLIVNDNDTINGTRTTYKERVLVPVSDCEDSEGRGFAPAFGSESAFAGGKEGINSDPDPDHAPELIPSESGGNNSSLPGDEFPTLAPEAYHGIVGDIVRAIDPETEADPAGVLLTILTAIGNAVGKSPRYAMMSGTHRGNLFACLVGGTASAKGQAWSIVNSLMERADPTWSRDSLAFGLSSGEGLVDRVKDPEPDPDADDTGAFIIADERRLLAVETEFARVLTASRREGNTLSPLIRSAWDGDKLEVLTRGKSKIRADNAHVSILAHITPEELNKLLNNSVEIANGFANRFVWACVRRSKSLPNGGDPAILDAWVEPLAKALERAKRIGRVRRDDAAESLWASVYDTLTTERPGAFGLATSRAHAITLRVSLLYAILDADDTIRELHLRAARAVWAYCEASASRIFGDGATPNTTDTPSPLDIRLLDAIVKAPGIKRSDLLREIRDANANGIGEALVSLENRSLAHKRTVHASGGGRPSEHWYPGSNVDPPEDEHDKGICSTDTLSPPKGGFAFVFAHEDENDDAKGIDTGDTLSPPATETASPTVEPESVSDDTQPAIMGETSTIADTKSSQSIDEDAFFRDLELAWETIK